MKDQFPDDVASGGFGPDGQAVEPALPLPCPQAQTIVAPSPPARPATLALPFDSLPVPNAAPPVKANVVASSEQVRKQTKSRAKVLTPEQVEARKAVMDCWYEEFGKAKHEKPSFDGKNVKECQRLLEKFRWDAGRVCVLIRNAFTQEFFRDRLCTLAELLNNTTRYQGQTRSSSAMKANGQAFPDARRWVEDLEEVSS